MYVYISLRRGSTASIRFSKGSNIQKSLRTIGLESSQRFNSFQNISKLLDCKDVFLPSCGHSLPLRNETTLKTPLEISVFLEAVAQKPGKIYPNRQPPTLTLLFTAQFPVSPEEKKNLFLPSSQLTEFYLLMPPASF